MLELYYSSDKGLLDSKVWDFSDRVGKYKLIRNPSTLDLEVCLIQQSTEEFQPNVVIEISSDFKNLSDFFECFWTLTSSVDLKQREVLLLVNQKNCSLPIALEKAISNSEKRLLELNHKTKRGYINDLLKRGDVNTKKEYLDVVKKLCPANAKDINELIENMSILSKANLLDQKSLNSLMSTVKREINYFDFFTIYLSKSPIAGVEFVNKNLNSQDSLKRFFGAMSYRLLELKRYLHLKNKFEDPKRISSVMKISLGSLHEYKSISKIFGLSLNKGLDKFTVSLYFFISTLKHSHFVNVEILKLFLLKNHIALF